MKALITSGGTSEPIDAVRKITNSSSGKLGAKVADELLKQPTLEKLYYVCSKHAVKPKNDIRIVTVIVQTAADVSTALQNILQHERIDLLVHSMAISDYSLDWVSTAQKLADYIETNSENNLAEEITHNSNILDQTQKISSSENNLLLLLKPNPKIISQIKLWSPNTYLVGFKLLSDANDQTLVEIGTKLLKKNACNIVVANSLNRITKYRHPAIFIYSDGTTKVVQTKSQISKNIVQAYLQKGETK